MKIIKAVTAKKCRKIKRMTEYSRSHEYATKK
jgi:hypothetical protein